MSGAAKERKSRSPLHQAWPRLLRHKGAVIGMVVLGVLVASALAAPWVAGYDPLRMDVRERLQAPSLAHLLGTDNFGRDIFARIVYAGRISLIVGFVAVGIGAICGGALGAISGYYGGWLDNLLMRLMDILLSVPQIVLALAIVGALGTSLPNLMVAVGISVLPRYARLVRASALTLRGLEFVEAARAAGASDPRIILQAILPNCLAPLIVLSTLGVAQAILSAATLSFLGLGVQPPTPEWGAMLSDGRQFLRNAPHITIFPGLAIVVVVMALNLVGDALRDALDPKLKV
jgi:peptide/nickel transport system permease protein